MKQLCKLYNTMLSSDDGDCVAAALFTVSIIIAMGIGAALLFDSDGCGFVVGALTLTTFMTAYIYGSQND